MTIAGDPPGFQVRLENFEGPFDLLLSLISRRRLDITDVALAEVTDEFIAYVGALASDDMADTLDEISEFLLIAATLLDLKTARLLPSGQVEDEEDLALLEARDLLFARLLQYRAYKTVAADLAETLADIGRSHPRDVALEPALAAELPPLDFRAEPALLAALAATLLYPRVVPEPTVSLEHLHTARVSVKEESERLAERLEEAGGDGAGFAELVRGADTLTVVVRFLALLEMFRARAVAFDQAEALGHLQVRLVRALTERDLEGLEAFDEEISGTGTNAGAGQTGSEGPAHDGEAAR